MYLFKFHWMPGKNSGVSRGSMLLFKRRLPPELVLRLVKFYERKAFIMGSDEAVTPIDDVRTFLTLFLAMREDSGKTGIEDGETGTYPK